MFNTEAKNHKAGGTSPFPLFPLYSLLYAFICFPLPLFGHGYEFLSARLTLLNGSSLVELKITAVYGANPMLPDSPAATKALHETLYIRYRDKLLRLADLAPLYLEQSTDWESNLPPSIRHADDGQEHQLMTALWRWKADVPEIAFSVPKGSMHDVLLWRQNNNDETQSILLLAGDVSKSIALKPPADWKRIVSLSALVTLGLLILPYLWKAHFKRGVSSVFKVR